MSMYVYPQICLIFIYDLFDSSQIIHFVDHKCYSIQISLYIFVFVGIIFPFSGFLVYISMFCFLCMFCFIAPDLFLWKSCSISYKHVCPAPDLFDSFQPHMFFRNENVIYFSVI
ncbi:hypothetical protein CsSME_00046156 [Camellia sinensis var. sinensis]